MLTAVTAGKAAPGATTSLWALAHAWPAALVLADCDVAGGDLAAGLPGYVDTAEGLLSWSASSRGEIGPTSQARTLAAHCQDLGPAIDRDVWLLAGCSSATQGRSFTELTWRRLATALRAVHETFERDVLVDTGRLTGPEGPWPVVQAADVVLVTVRCTLRSVHAAQDLTSRLADQLGGLSKVRAAVVDDGPYPVGDVLAALGLPLAASLPHDPAYAATLSDGAPMGGRARRRSPLLTAAGRLAEKLCEADPDRGSARETVSA